MAAQLPRVLVIVLLGSGTTRASDDNIYAVGVPRVSLNGKLPSFCPPRPCLSRCTALCSNRTRPVVDLPLRHQRGLPPDKFNGCYPLRPAAFRRSLVEPGAARLRRFLERLDAGGDATVVVLGGSVATGFASGGASSSYYSLEWLQWRYPRAKVARLVLAQPGTDSFYFAAHLERMPRNADLVLVDYLTNDLGILDGDTTPRTMRAVTEKIMRAALALPRRPAVVLVALLRTIALTNRQHFAFQDTVRPVARTCAPHRQKTRFPQVYAPLAAAYNVTLVSFKDAIWPDFEQPPQIALYETVKGSHPRWTVHQLIADTLAYACAVAASNPGGAIPPVPIAPIFLDANVEALETCRAPLTHYAGATLRAAAQPGAGWRWWDLRATKEGWEYNATATSRLQERQLATARVRKPPTHNLRAQPRLAPAAPHRLHSPLTFWMNFSATSRPAWTMLCPRFTQLSFHSQAGPRSYVSAVVRAVRCCDDHNWLQ